MERVEEKIRKHLARDLSIISNELTLIQEEYPLKNVHGSSGFIDILAKDLENNYVVIELKRSNQAARQTLNEVCKYCALLKQNLHIRDSEIRVIIISSEWRELLVPYSEFCNYTNLYIEGYKVNLDHANIPISTEQIIPINTDYQRKFSTEHLAFLYTSNVNIDRTILEIKDILPQLGISDYVILKMNTTNEIPFPFCIYLVFQRYTEYYYLNALRRIKDKLKKEYAIYDEVLEYKENYKNDEEGYLRCLEEHISCYITDKVKSDSLEIGYPEKFQNMLHQFNWQVNEVIKGGCFENDLRLSKDIIILEVMGINGMNEQLYINQTHSKHKPKLAEIRNNATNCLFFNKVWNNNISSIFNTLGIENKDFRISLFIFNTDCILEAIAGTAYYRMFSYLPSYDFFIDYTNENKLMIYHGKVTWNGVKREFKEIIKIFFKGDPFNYFMKRQFGGLAELDSLIMEYLGLQYTSSLSTVNDGKAQIEDIAFINDRMEKAEPILEKDFIEFLDENEEFVKDLIQFFNSHCIGLLR